MESQICILGSWWNMQALGGTLYVLPHLIKNNTLKPCPEFLCQGKSVILLELVNLSIFSWLHNPQIYI